MITRPFCIIVALGVAQAATAQGSDDGVSFRLGLGAQVKPGYFGAEDTVVGPFGGFDLESLRLGTLSAGDGKKYGLGPSASIRFVRAREADEFEELTGLEDLDASLEIGGGLKYTAPDYEVFGNLRYGVIGHESFVAEIGGDYIYRPTPQIELTAGPRLLWGSDDFAQTYFGVTGAESAASGFDAFDASSGLVSAGVKAEATYFFNDDWGITGSIRYDQLQQDAADSPISESDDQLGFGVRLSRKITLGF